jgi:hypothetical protein
MSDPEKNLMLYALMLGTVSIAALLSAFVSTGGPAPAAPSLVRAKGFAALGGSTVTNTGATKITGDVGVSSPRVSVTGFPPGTIARGAQHVGDPPANQAQRDAQTAYRDRRAAKAARLVGRRRAAQSALFLVRPRAGYTPCT